MIIKIENISKNYGDVQALNDVSLQVDKNSTFALIGQNGAGKTTLVKSILNLIKTDNGSISLMGNPPEKAESRDRIAYLPEKFSFFPYYTVKGTVSFYCQVRGIPKEQKNSEIERVLEKTNISSLAKRKLNTLSKGQLQRLGIATTLIGHPQLIIWDEPFTGLDPIGIRDIKALIKELSEQDVTLFINSHILSEVEKICDYLAIIDQGKCIAQGRIDQLKKESSLEDFFCNAVRGES